MLKDVATYIKHKGWVYVGLLIGTFFCYKTIVFDHNFKLGIIIGCLPLIVVVGSLMFRKTLISFLALFIVNYYIMGINRYAPIPVGVVIDGLFALLVASLIFKTAYEFVDWKKAWNGLTIMCLLWFFYCLFELSNNVTSATAEDWLQGVRSMAIYPLLTVIVSSILMKRVEYINWFLLIWGVLVLTAAAKGYWQKNRGFDSYELRWLFLGDGARTHLISTGIRYFSFFSDAGNYGSNMGFSLVVFTIASFFSKNKLLKLAYLIIGLAGGYGMIISGTRGALAVPFAGFALFVLLSKNWKMFLGMSAILIGSFVFLNYTTIGESNSLIRRMRTAFNPEDASLQVRVINQRTLSILMSDLPFGVGIGAHAINTDTQSNAWRIVNTPHDSWIIKVWTRTGPIGLAVYFFTMGITFLIGSYYLMFRVKNKRLRGILTGMLCGVFGMLVSSYGNDFFTQFPNCVLIYLCLSLVFLGPYFDKQLEKDDSIKLLTPKKNEANS